MDIEKLIHCLQCCAMVDAHNVGCDDCGLEYCGPECQQLCWTAATALSTLQAENEKLRSEAEGMRSNWYKSVEEIQKLRAELKQVKRENDALWIYIEIVDREYQRYMDGGYIDRLDELKRTWRRGQKED